MDNSTNICGNEIRLKDLIIFSNTMDCGELSGILISLLENKNVQRYLKRVDDFQNQEQKRNDYLG